MKDIDIKEPFLAINSYYWLFQKIGYLLLFIVLLSALFGLTGNGIFGQATAWDDQKKFKIQYDSINRSHVNNVITLFVDPQYIRSNSVIRVSLSQESFKHTLIKQILPKAISARINNNMIDYFIQVGTYTSYIPIQISFEPQQAGINHVKIELDNYNSISFTQLTLP